MQRRATATTLPELIFRTSGSPPLATPRWSVGRGPLPQWDACSRPRYSGAHSPGAGASSGTNYSTGRHREAHGVSLQRRRGSGGQLRLVPRSPAGSRPPSTTLGSPDPGRGLGAGRCSPTWLLISRPTKDVRHPIGSLCAEATRATASAVHLAAACARVWLDSSLPAPYDQLTQQRLPPSPRCLTIH